MYFLNITLTSHKHLTTCSLFNLPKMIYALSGTSQNRLSARVSIERYEQMVMCHVVVQCDDLHTQRVVLSAYGALGKWALLGSEFFRKYTDTQIRIGRMVLNLFSCALKGTQRTTILIFLFVYLLYKIVISL